MLAFAITSIAPGPSYAATPSLTTLVTFNGTDGGQPWAGLIADASGNLFGTTTGGGAYNDGTVFEIVKTADGYASTPTTLVTFNGTDGSYPQAGLIADASGNLFGTTTGGGASGYGTVFEIVKTADGYASTPITLVSFNGNNGSYPQAGLIADASGDLFGTASGGGAYDGPYGGYGTVFEVVNNGTSAAPSYASTPTTLVSFNGPDGAYPMGGLIADASGDLFGTTVGDGAYNNYGTVFEIVKTVDGYASTPTTLVSFNGPDGAVPMAGLIADAKGNLFGTTSGARSGKARCLRSPRLPVVTPAPPPP